MITIYHLSNSRSERIIWLMEELGLPYRVEKFQRDANMLAPAAMRAIHPLGKSPMIRDGDVVLIESGAIVEYIINRHGGGRLAPAVNAADYPRYLQWLHFAEGSALAYLVGRLFLGDGSGMLGQISSKDFLDENCERYIDYMESTLGEQPYFAGANFTAADIMMVYVIDFLKRFEQRDLAPYPNMVRYFARIGERPAFQKAMAFANSPA